MGAYNANNQGSSNKTNYYSISNGKIIKEWKEKPKEDWIPIDTELKERIITKGKNQGDIRYYVEYTNLSGDIVDIKLEKVESGNRIAIHLLDEFGLSILQLDMNSSYGESFLKRLKNIDLGKKVDFRAWLSTPEEWFKFTKGKTIKNNKVGLTITQDNVKVLPFYTMENPNGLPPLVKKMKFGEEKWDSEDRDNFLYEQLVEYIANAKFTTQKIQESNHITHAQTHSQIIDANDIDDDDLPF